MQLLMHAYIHCMYMCICMCMYCMYANNQFGLGMSLSKSKPDEIKLPVQFGSKPNSVVYRVNFSYPNFNFGSILDW